jgi:hypothetical protein
MQVTPKLQAWLLFEYLGTARTGKALLKMAPYTDLEPGLTWQINKQVSFTPYLDLKTSNRVALDTTTINANVTLSAL